MTKRQGTGKKRRTEEKTSQEFMAMLQDAFGGHSDLLDFGQGDAAFGADDDGAEDVLRRAMEASSREKSIEILKAGKKKYKRDLDIQMALIGAEQETPEAVLHEARKLINRETKKLVTKGILPEEDQLWYHWECRPYMRIRYQYMMDLVQLGHIRQAMEEGKWLLSVSRNDNLGVRYILMALYAFYEEADAAEQLYEEFDKESDVMMRLPLAVLYYRLGDYKKARRYLIQAENVMPDLSQYLYKIIDNLDYITGDVLIYSYALGSEEEFIATIKNFELLYISTGAFISWAYYILKDS